MEVQILSSAPTTRPRAVARTQSRDGRQRISAPDTKLRTAHGVAEVTLNEFEQFGAHSRSHGLTPAMLKGHTICVALRPAVLLPKPQTLAGNNYRIFGLHHILTSSLERSTVHAGCESCAGFSSCAPLAQAPCRSQVYENPNHYARSMGKAGFEAVRFWRRAD